MVVTTVPREVTENMARAKAYLKRDELLRSLGAAALSLRAYTKVKIVGNAKFIAEVSFHEYVNELALHPHIRSFFISRGILREPVVVYKEGQEHDLAKGLDALKGALEKVENANLKEKEEQEHAERLELLRKGLGLLYTNGEEAKGRAVLRRYIDIYGAEQGVIGEIADHFLKAGLPVEATELFEQAMAAFPADPKGFTGAIEAYTVVGDKEKVEDIYMLILKNFGGHPKTYLNMSRFYQGWNKREKARDYATRALQGDKSLKEAQEIIDKLDKRL